MGLQLGMAKQGTPMQVSRAGIASPRAKEIMVGLAVADFPQYCAVSQDPASITKLVEGDPTHIQSHSQYTS